MTTYRIKDWERMFENNRTRELKQLNWVPIPTKLDGDGYTELVDGEDGAALYGCWVACVIVAGRCDPRGTLVRDNGEPHDSTSLSRISRLDGNMFHKMLEKTLSIGWLEVIDVAPSCEILAPSCLEGKGREGKEEKHKSASSKDDDSRSGNGRNREVYSPSFEMFWTSYPKQRRRDKRTTYTRWKSAGARVQCEGDPEQFLIDRARDYAKSWLGRSEYAKMPASWLNANGWEDEPSAWENPDQSQQGPRVATAEELANWTP